VLSADAQDHVGGGSSGLRAYQRGTAWPTVVGTRKSCLSSHSLPEQHSVVGSSSKRSTFLESTEILWCVQSNVGVLS
jgi:hypothetical protein